MYAKQPAIPQFAPRYQILDVKVTRCASDGNGFRWSVRERNNNRVLQTGVQTYPTEAEAFRAGNAAARAYRKQG